MHDRWTAIERRLERTVRQRLAPFVHRTVAPLELTVWPVTVDGGEPVPFAVALPEVAGHDPSVVDYQPTAVGAAWGAPWTTSWFHLTGTVPDSAAGAEVELLVDLGWGDQGPGFQAEGLVYRPDGTVVKALNPRNSWVPISDAAEAGAAIDLYVEAAANPFVHDNDPVHRTRLGERSTAGDEPLYRLLRADVAVFERDLWELLADLDVAGGIARHGDETAPRRYELLTAIERALDRLDVADPAAGAAAARKELADELASPAHASAHRISAVGHAHIDSAWLWPVRETVRKVRRTTANVVDLLDRYPDLVFAMSQPQQLAWVEEHQPDLFERIRQHVAGGRFVPVGGTWIEPDTNLVGGEAMARQFLYGKRYLIERFGIDPQEVWLPDTFGYSPALPQLVRLAGSRWFLTQKISWNTTNRFPHHSFWWEGIDGTRVFTHFPPVDTYNAELSMEELTRSVRNFRDKGAAKHSLAPFGWGDGGGGPTREMIARAQRTADLEGAPRVTIEPAAEFFAAAEADYADAPVWSGELYLELHRGTFTSQAVTKQGNRRSEHLLREAELWSSAAAVAGLVDYPYDALERIWKLVLLNQFHDILPGTSIAWVHRVVAEEYAAIAAELETIIATATAALAGADDGDAADDAAQPVTFNAGPFVRDGVTALGASLGRRQPGAVAVEHDGGDIVIDNGLLRVVVDGDGIVRHLVDLEAGRDVLVAGSAGNLLQLHPDVPNDWDAWDVDVFYRNTVADLLDAESVELVADGADGVATVRVRRSFGDSTVVQEITLRDGARQVEFVADVDWREREKFLKAAFDLDVHSRRAAFETQFGHHYRDTHENTSWDASRFEVSTQRWVHVAEPGYGVAIANEATYGLDFRRNANPAGATSTTVRLSLLRAPRFPDPGADQGSHRLAYALVAGAEIVDAVRAGYTINLPLRTVEGRRAVEPIVTIDGAGVVVEAVKLAEDRSGDVVVRLYEALGQRSVAAVNPGFAYDTVDEVDLIERPLERDALDDIDAEAADGVPGVPTVRLRPFQIATLRFRRSRSST